MKIIFTDLDGTLLDHDTYSFEPACEALARAKEMGVPLVLCSSKTRAEMEVYSEKLGLMDPFIAENGSGIYFPPSYALEDIPGSFMDGAFRVLELGAKREKLREAFLEVKHSLGVEMTSFTDMSVMDVMALTSLAERNAMLAMERHFTEPFVISSQDTGRADEIVGEFKRLGFTVVKGGRFYHLMGNASKGDAVKRITLFFSSRCGRDIISMGLGDAENDIDMLQAVDRAAIVRRWDGGWLGTKGTEDFMKTEKIGPAGWNDAVLDFLND